jgi:voltage-gated potassium channel
MIFFRTILSFLLDKGYRDLLITTAFVLLVGTVAYHFIEGWSWIDSIYFSVTTLSTVGYGDFTPKTDLGKIFTIFYIIIGIGIILTFINTIYQHYSNHIRKSKDIHKH